MKTILILCGGRSTEHEIALRSAKSVINGLDRKAYHVEVCYIDKKGRFLPLGALTHIEHEEELVRTSDRSRLETISDFCLLVERLSAESEALIVFPVLHGQTGEDGEIQGFLQTLGVPYVGNRLTTSALCMDKGFANEIFRACGLPEADYLVYTRTQWEADGKKSEALAKRISDSFGFPCFVKPANNGSSVGVSRATEATLTDALTEAFRFDRRIVIEEEIQGHELEVSILGNAHPKASLPGSYTSTHEVLDYEAKYNDTSTKENVPHPLSPEMTKAVQKLALQAYEALGCEGFARVDLFLGDDGKLYLNEINTFPGMTPSSLAPKLWTALTEMTFRDYLDELIAYALESEAAQNTVETSWRQA
ncbi:D-alanine--D-alanine ligase family protein [Murdochiella vaginalis]|uniref:D-alanine--D-alanine ligase family protein n=1 Tax=Murdochiella vaginalis TaxID=1852373 RepID=UPI0008FD9FA2|nr:D-alanine--D-alanine ligase family protein [Murdochiella vaginalis]